MAITLPLKKMSREDKLRALEAIGADLASDDEGFESPAWHAAELRETEQRVKEGKATFSDWEQAKERIRRKAAKSS